MSLLDRLAAFFRPAPPPVKPWPPCDLFDERDNEERVCSACGVEWWLHEHRCGFDEVGAENERRWRADSGQAPIPFEDEPCDACGEVRSHRKHANGGEP